MRRPKIRLLLVDDHFFVRKGLAVSLSEEADCAVVAEAGSGAEAIAHFRQHQPDVTLMDFVMHDVDGVSALATIRAEAPQARVIMFTVNEREEEIFRAVHAGARGYLPKTVERPELLRAIRAVHEGGTYFPEHIARALATRQARAGLSPRELDVLHHIVVGRSNKEIAGALGLSDLTVRQYVSAILRKLDVLDRTQAATAAVQRGFVRLE